MNIRPALAVSAPATTASQLRAASASPTTEAGVPGDSVDIQPGRTLGQVVQSVACHVSAYGLAGLAASLAGPQAAIGVGAMAFGVVGAVEACMTGLRESTKAGYESKGMLGALAVTGVGALGGLAAGAAIGGIGGILGPVGGVAVGVALGAYLAIRN